MILKLLAAILALLVMIAGIGCAPAATPVPTVGPTTAASIVLTPAPTSVPTSAPTSVPTIAPSPVPAAATAAASATATGSVITDAAGRKVTVAGNPQRIVSLAPNLTEILFALDLGPKVVGVDDFSDFPVEVKAVTKIGGSNGKYNFEQIVAAKPDLVLAAGITAPDAIKKLEDLHLTVVVIGSVQTTLEGIQSDLALVGQVTGRGEQAKRLSDGMKQTVEGIRAKVATAKSKPRVYWELDATDPAKPFTVGPGNFINDVISLAGGSNIFGSLSSPFPQVGTEQIVAANPEVVVLSDAAYGTSVESVLKRPGYEQIDAVKKKQVFPIDDNLVSRPGPRIAQGIQVAAKLIHPELFP